MRLAGKIALFKKVKKVNVVCQSKVIGLVCINFANTTIGKKNNLGFQNIQGFSEIYELVD